MNNKIFDGALVFHQKESLNSSARDHWLWGNMIKIAFPSDIESSSVRQNKALKIKWKTIKLTENMVAMTNLQWIDMLSPIVYDSSAKAWIKS